MRHQVKPDAIFQFVAAAMVLLASLIAYQTRFDTLTLPSEYAVISLAITLVSYCFLSINGYYEKTHRANWWVSLREALKVMLVTGTLIALLLYLTKSGAVFSRIWMSYTMLGASLLIALARVALNSASRSAYKAKNILLLGNDKSSEKLAARIREQQEGHLTIRRHVPQLDQLHGKQIGDICQYIESVRNSEEAIAEIWITADIYSRFSHLELATALSDSSVRLVYIPLVPDLEFAYEIEDVDGILTINSGLARSNRLRTLLKKIEDIILSSIALLALLPLFLLIAIAIKLDSRGPVFYKQQRYGINGREIKVWKFRSMSVTESSADFVQATQNDQRITRVGHFLRKSSLDELPQLFNVLGGSMSLVGPRPHPNLLNEQFRGKIDYYMQRHNVKPGITGLAQAHGARGETETLEKMQRRIAYDLEYVKNWSLLLDLKIIYRTFIEVIKQSMAKSST